MRNTTDALLARTCAVLVGLPGSGRRVLVDRIRDAVADELWRVLRIAGTGSRPLEALTLAGHLPTAAGRVATVAAAAEGLADAAGTGPCLLIVEDADHLDDVSAAVIAAVLERTDVTVLATTRPPFPRPGALEQLLRRRESTAAWVPALPFEEMQRLLAEVLGGDLDPDAAARIYALSGGLPGIAHAIAVEARRAGRVTLFDGRWRAGREIWTPALAVQVARLTQGLPEVERDALWTLAELGTVDLDSARQLVPWPVFAGLDDAGLLQFVEAAEVPLVALFPPLLAEHYRQSGRGARGWEAASRVARTHDGDAGALREATRRAVVASQTVGSTSAEAAAILGRLMRAQATREVVRTRENWERTPSDATALDYVHALLEEGRDLDLIDLDPIEQVLAARRALPTRGPAHVRVEAAAWEATYRAFIRHDLDAAFSVIEETIAAVPESSVALRATQAHLALVMGVRADLPELPPPGAEHLLGLTGQSPHDVVRMVRGEILISSNRTDDAQIEFSQVSFADPLLADRDALVPLARVCAGDIDAALDDAGRQLDIARGTLDRAHIEPYAYVIALGLYAQGRLASLRSHLTATFAVGATAPLRPASRAGLLSLGASLALIEQNFASAQSFIRQVEALDLPGAPFPLTRIEPAAAALAMMRGEDGDRATQRAWERVDELIDNGQVLAALLDGARLIDLHLDEERTARLVPLARAGQGRMMPLLAAYLEAALERSPDGLLTAADALWAAGHRLHATRASVLAITSLRAAGDVERATEESAALRGRVSMAGEDLQLLVPSASTPAAELTTREREIATLVAGGMSNRDVAARLHVSERTVDNHVYRIFRKLGIASRDDLAVLL